MQQEDDLRALAKIMEFGRAVSIFLLVVHVYVYCYPSITAWHLNLEVIDRILVNFNDTTGIFNCILWSKLLAVLLLAVSCLGTHGVKGEKITWPKIYAALVAGCALFFLNWWLLELPLPHMANTAFYIFTLTAGYLALLMSGLWMSRLYRHNLMEDVFNMENESFMQETRLMENEYSVNLPTRFYYKKRWNNGFVNIVNIFRACMVIGTPGSGKSYAIVNSYIRQLIAKGFAIYIYDYKCDDLSTIAYNSLLKNMDKYEVKPRFYVINFDDPRRSHRCNPINPEFMTDISDAYEASYQPQSHLDRKTGRLLRGVPYHSSCGNNLVFKDLQERYLLHVSPCGGTAQQTLLGSVHHPDLLSGARKLPFPLHGRMERKCPGPAPGPDSLGKNTPYAHDLPTTLLGDDR